MADLLGVGRVDLYLNYDRPMSQEELTGFRRRVQRRAAREPAAYIIGRKEFYSLDFKVNSEVLIPRPETELLVDEALRLSSERWPVDQPLQLADLGTGSGALAVTLAVSLGGRAAVWAVDIHASALATARSNAENHQVAERIHFFEGDLFDPLVSLDSKFHLIMANLPYIPKAAFEDMQPEVRDYEPHLGLDGGEDGLLIIRRAIAGAGEHLVDSGLLILEIWPTHTPRIEVLAKEHGFESVHIIPDLSGRDRVAVLDRKKIEA